MVCRTGPMTIIPLRSVATKPVPRIQASTACKRVTFFTSTETGSFTCSTSSRLNISCRSYCRFNSRSASNTVTCFNFKDTLAWVVACEKAGRSVSSSPAISIRQQHHSCRQDKSFPNDFLVSFFFINLYIK
ncbi:unknown [Odoribacter splanchnicus CAG:14]|nr:unknown [Odoribacter splanchnicus CAG:14]